MTERKPIVAWPVVEEGSNTERGQLRTPGEKWTRAGVWQLPCAARNASAVPLLPASSTNTRAGPFRPGPGEWQGLGLSRRWSARERTPQIDCREHSLRSTRLKSNGNSGSELFTLPDWSCRSPSASRKTMMSTAASSGTLRMSKSSMSLLILHSVDLY